MNCADSLSAKLEVIILSIDKKSERFVFTLNPKRSKNNKASDKALKLYMEQIAAICLYNESLKESYSPHIDIITFA